MLTPLRGDIETNVLAAASRWAEFLDGSGSIEILVRLDESIPRATGRSLTSSFVRRERGLDIFEQGMVAELRTGVDPNGPMPDVEISLSSGYTFGELWFDPEPASRTEPVPPSRTDAMSVLLHEFGHAIGFNGWHNQMTGELPDTFASTYDSFVQFEEGNLFFVGLEAADLYGDIVPLTFGNSTHLGNRAPRPGEDLISDLMNGVVFYRGTRYDVSLQTLAVLNDASVALQTPCPADLDDDGELTIFDFLTFQNLFDLMDPRADFDGDGDFTIFDFLAFQNAFDAGC